MHTWIPRAAAAAVATASMLAFTAGPAAAHTRLSSSDPAAGSAVAAALSAITLTFNEPVKVAATVVTVAGADLVNRATGPATAVDSTVTQPVAALPIGAVKVDWRTVSLDGHPIQGSFTFTNTAPPPSAEPATPATPAIPATTPATRDPAASGPVGGGSGVSPVWWVLAGVVLLAAVAGGVLRARRRRT